MTINNKHHKLRIVALTHTDVSTDSRIRKTAYSVINAFADSTYFLIGRSYSNCSSYSCDKDLNLAEISVFLLSSSLSKKLRVLRSFFSFLELNAYFLYWCIKIRPRIIHCHDLSGVYVALIYKLFSRCRVIFDAHELEASRNGLSPFSHVLTTIYEFPVVKLFDKIITVSDSISLWYKWKGARSVTTIANKPLTSSSSSGQVTLLDILPPKNKEALNLVYVGILCPGRGIESIVSELSGNRQFNVYFLGEGPLKNYIQKISTHVENIYQHDYVSHDYVSGFISCFDLSLCLVEPVSLSDYFALPNKIYESLSACVPVIGSSLPEIASLLRDNEFGFVVKSMSEINTLSSRRKDLQLIKNNLKLHRDIFSWQYESNSLVELYSDLL